MTRGLLHALLASVALATYAGAQNGCSIPPRDSVAVGARAAKSDKARAVLTQHNDNGRTGAYERESVLNPTTVSSGRFGKLFSRRVKGQVYAQPLYVPDLEMPGVGVRDVLFVATMHNNVYAFDADDPEADTPFWCVQLGNALPYNFMPMTFGALGHNIKPEIGITSTPVIDLARGTMYISAKVCEIKPQRCRQSRDKVAYYLHAIDITTGHERPNSPQRIYASCQGTKRNGQPRTLQFDARPHLQRPGLLLANDRVYLAFGSHQDTRPFHGWVIAYDANTLNQVAAYCATPTGDEAGIWQAGNGLASDASGNIYVMTGNGTFTLDRGGNDAGSSFIKLNPDLQLIDWYTPANFRCLNQIDVDLGAAGPVLIPGSELLVGGGKEGTLFLLDRATLGHLESADAESIKDRAPCARSGSRTKPPPLHAIQAAPHYRKNVMDVVRPAQVFGYNHIHGSPVLWYDTHGDVIVYVWPEHGHLYGFRLDVSARRFPDASPRGADPKPTIVSPEAAPEHGMPGGILAASGITGDNIANAVRTESGIIWAAMPQKGDAFVHTVSGILRAFRASDLKEIWNSEKNPGRDRVGNFAKYASPTIANGRVYLATFSEAVDVYGILPQPDSAPRAARERQ